MRVLTSMTILVAMMTTSPGFARKASHHFRHTMVSKHQPTPKTNERGGVERHPDDVALDRKIRSICRGC
jgi:hypothetical protein